MISEELFRCAVYMAEVITTAKTGDLESFYASDYIFDGIKNGDPRAFLMGGDCCSLLCIFFPERCDRTRRSLRVSDYQYIGTQLYYRYYSETGRSIGLCMARNFENIVDITRQCLINKA